MKLSKKAKILLYGSNLWYLGEGMFGPLFAVFASKVGGNVLDITWAWAVYLIVTGIVMIGIGAVSDKLFKKEKMLFIGYVLNVVLTFCYLLVDSPLRLMLVQVGLGFATALQFISGKISISLLSSSGTERVMLTMCKPPNVSMLVTFNTFKYLKLSKLNW